jgi:hypothetical protein
MGTSFVFGQKASQKKVWMFTMDVGSDYSVGPKTIKDQEGELNRNYAISYYSIARYNHPSLRMRISALRALTGKLWIGLQTGLTYRFDEIMLAPGYMVSSVPVQARMLYRLSHGNKLKFYFDGAAGANIFRLYTRFSVQRTGELISIGSVLESGNFCFRLGGEYQADRGYGIVNENLADGIVNEQVKYRTNRFLIYGGVGFNF